MDKIRSFIIRIFSLIQYRVWFVFGWIKENKKKFAITTLFVVIILGSIFWFFLRTYHNYEIVDSSERQGDTSANYHFSEKGTLCYSKDGVSFSNNKGEVIWNQVFGMELPKMDNCGEYIAIGDIGANNIYIFNYEGTKGRLTLDKPIQDLRISKQGVVAVVLADDDANQINLYDKNGKILAGIKATIATSGYPLSLALSDDGTRLVVNYIMFNGGKVNSQLVFYNFSNKETSTEPSGSFVFDELFPKIEFVDDNLVLACGETGFYTYQFKDTVLENNSQKFLDEAKSIFLTDKYIGIITKNLESVTEGEEVDKYKVQIYRFTGSKAGDFTFDFNYKEVSASDSDIIFYNEQECEIYSYHGHKKFQHVFDTNIDCVLPGDKDGQYILMDAQNVQTITLK